MVHQRLHQFQIPIEVFCDALARVPFGCQFNHTVFRCPKPLARQRRQMATPAVEIAKKELSNVSAILPVKKGLRIAKNPLRSEAGSL